MAGGPTQARLRRLTTGGVGGRAIRLAGCAAVAAGALRLPAATG